MKPIRIITPGFTLLGEIDDYTSLWFTRSWHGIGQIEMRINRYKKHIDSLVNGNLIIAGPKKAYVIMHREIELDEKGKETENWIIKGLALKSVTGYRLNLPPPHTAYDVRQGNGESVMRHYLINNVVNPIDINRKIDLLQLASNQNRGPWVSWQSRYKNLAEELAEISLMTELGWDITMDNNLEKWIFDVKIGQDLTVNQSSLPPVIFTPQFESLRSIKYTDSELNYRNVAYVAGQGEGTDRRVLELGSASGLNRREVFIDARDVAEVDENDQPLPAAQVNQALTDRGLQKLLEMTQEKYLEGQIMSPVKRTVYERIHAFVSPVQPDEQITRTTKMLGPFIYEEDYDLGDKVTIQNKSWGITMDARITEIKEIYEVGGFKLEATFGNNRPTLIKKLKQELAQISAEVRR
jgi:hypothetical protein